MTPPRAYYNDNDPQACAWLRELIARGHLPDGDVDERSILDVRPADLAGYTACHFFAGIGGWPYALRLAGWPDSRPVWTGSPPCQPFSSAGLSLGRDDPRHLSPKFAGLVGACRPPMLFGEQVASADVFGPAAKGNRPGFEGAPPWAWLDDLSDRMEAARYAFGASDIPSAGIGAPHIRQRTFFGAVDLEWLEHAARDGWDEWDEWGAEPSRRGIASGCGPGGLADSHGNGCAEGRRSWPAQEHDGAARNCAAGRLGDSQQPRLEGYAGHGDRGHEPGRIGAPAAGSASEAGATGRMADSSGIGRRARRDRDNRGDDRTQLAADGPDDRPGPTNGFWSDPDWLLCRDGKWRPVIGGHVGVADGIPDDMVRGSNHGLQVETREQKVKLNADASQADAREVLPSVQREDGAQEIQRADRGSFRVQEAGFLQSGLHGDSDGKGPLHERQSQPIQGEQADETGLRGVRSHGKAARPSQGRGPFEQRSIELEDVVSELPSQIALAELHGRWRDAEALQTLCKSICEAGSVLFAPDEVQQAWRSLGREGQDRIRLAFGPIWVARQFSPLSSGEPGRVMRLRGYGNAINPHAAAEFVKAFTASVMEVWE